MRLDAMSFAAALHFGSYVGAHIGLYPYATGYLRDASSSACSDTSIERCLAIV